MTSQCQLSLFYNILRTYLMNYVAMVNNMDAIHKHSNTESPLPVYEDIFPKVVCLNL